VTCTAAASVANCHGDCSCRAQGGTAPSSCLTAGGCRAAPKQPLHSRWWQGPPTAALGQVAEPPAATSQTVVAEPPAAASGQVVTPARCCGQRSLPASAWCQSKVSISVPIELLPMTLDQSSASPFSRLPCKTVPAADEEAACLCSGTRVVHHQGTSGPHRGHSQHVHVGQPPGGAGCCTGGGSGQCPA
jgi:hypothetical protein